MKFVELVSHWNDFGRFKTSAGWKMTQDDFLRLHIIPVIGDLELEEITPLKIASVLKRLEDKGYSSQTRIHIFNLLNKIFKDSIEIADIKIINPVKKQFRPVLVSRATPYLQVEHSFLLLAKSLGSLFETAVFLEILTGIRIGEIQFLDWSNVNFETDEINICGTYEKKTKTLQPHPKNKKHNLIPMPPLLREHLWKRKKPSGFVVEVNGNMLSQNSYHNFLRRICKENSLPRVSSHGLRHSCTEIWVNAGASEIDLMRLLNHSSAKTTHKYIHRSNQRLKAISLNIAQEIKKIS